MRRVDVGNKVQTRRVAREGLERVHRHRRPQIGAADADVHHISDAESGVAGPSAAANLLGKLAHVIQRGVDFRHHVGVAHEHRPARSIAQGHVHHGALLGEVDRLTGKHLVAECFDTARLGKTAERLHHVVGNQMLRVVGVKASDVDAEAHRARRISGKEVAEMLIGHERAKLR